MRTAVDAGFARAFWTVFDAHVTNFVAGVVLYSYGSGPIRGFAVTLLIGIVTNLFTSVWFSRWMFDALVGRRGAGTRHPLDLRTAKTMAAHDRSSSRSSSRARTSSSSAGSASGSALSIVLTLLTIGDAAVNAYVIQSRGHCSTGASTSTAAPRS